MKNFIRENILMSILPKQKMLEDENIICDIEEVSLKIIESYNNGNKVLIFGNGGSAADSQHIAGELVSKFRLNRGSLPAIAVTTDTSVITSIGNDFEYNYIFEKQVEGLANKGEIRYTNKAIVVPSNDTPRIQGIHILIAHIICDIVEKTLYGDNKVYEQSSVS